MIGFAKKNTEELSKDRISCLRHYNDKGRGDKKNNRERHLSDGHGIGTEQSLS